jgi:hypothetical protein
MNSFITFFLPHKRHFDDNEFEVDNPEPFKREREPDIQDLSSKIITTVYKKKKKKNNILSVTFFKMISIIGNKLSANC